MQIVGCDFTLADVEKEPMSVVTTCLGFDSDSDVTSEGFARVVPDSCDVDEVSWLIFCPFPLTF